MTKSTTSMSESTTPNSGVDSGLWALAWTLGAALFTAVFVANHVSHDWLLLQCLRDGHGRAECLELAGVNARNFDGRGLAAVVMDACGVGR